MIEIHELTKSYGAVEALRGISCRVKEGEIVGLLGPNGAGKTTAIKILTGYLQPGGGSVQVDVDEEHNKIVFDISEAAKKKKKKKEEPAEA